MTEVAQLPQTVLENDVMLEAAVREAFEQAASAHFPDSVIRPEVRETAQAPGIWLAMPRNRRRKYYRKYSRVFDVDIAPQVASNVKIFNGATLADFLKDVMLIPPGKIVKAKMHVYELCIGSRLPDIAARETNVPGLGNRSWGAWCQIHPLTPEAAMALLREPGLARPVTNRFVSSPYLTRIGQRFYYLQIPGFVRPRPFRVASAKLGIVPQSASNKVNLTVDLGRARLIVRLQFSERTAQEIAKCLRRKDIAGAYRAASALKQMLLDCITTRRVGFKLKGFEFEQYVGVPALEAEGGLAAGVVAKLLDKFMDKIVDLIWTGIVNYFKNTAHEFIRATEDPADGVVMYLEFTEIPLLEQIRKARQGVGGFLSAVAGINFAPLLQVASLVPRITIFAGCNR